MTRKAASDTAHAVSIALGRKVAQKQTVEETLARWTWDRIVRPNECQRSSTRGRLAPERPWADSRASGSGGRWAARPLETQGRSSEYEERNPDLPPYRDKRQCVARMGAACYAAAVAFVRGANIWKAAAWGR